MDKKVFLTQTDTTIGLLSKDKTRLNSIKKRPIEQKIIKTSPYLSELKKIARVPSSHKNKARKAKKTTFIYPNSESFRIIFGEHVKFYKNYNLDWVYSTSANEHKKNFDISISKKVDIIIKPFYENKPSTIIKLGKTRVKKIR